MKNRNFALLSLATFIFAISAVGCSGNSSPSSVTEDVEQSAIDEYKEMEKQIEQEAMEDMDLGK